MDAGEEVRQRVLQRQGHREATDAQRRGIGVISMPSAASTTAGHASGHMALHAIVVGLMSQRGLFYGWVILAAAATVVAFGQGALFSLGIFLKPLEESMHWSRSAISVIALINWVAMGAGSFFWGAVSDRLGSRGVTIAGGALLGLGLVVSSQAT